MFYRNSGYFSLVSHLISSLAKESKAMQSSADKNIVKEKCAQANGVYEQHELNTIQTDVTAVLTGVRQRTLACSNCFRI